MSNNRMVDISNRLHHWFAENNINTEGLTIIMNFNDAKEAYKFDWYLNKELEQIAMAWSDPPKVWVETKNFQINGLKFKVERPA